MRILQKQMMEEQILNDISHTNEFVWTGGWMLDNIPSKITRGGEQITEFGW